MATIAFSGSRQVLRRWNLARWQMFLVRARGHAEGACTRAVFDRGAPFRVLVLIRLPAAPKASIFEPIALGAAEVALDLDGRQATAWPLEEETLTLESGGEWT